MKSTGVVNRSYFWKVLLEELWFSTFYKDVSLNKKILKIICIEEKKSKLSMLAITNEYKSRTMNIKAESQDIFRGRKKDAYSRERINQSLKAH